MPDSHRAQPSLFFPHALRGICLLGLVWISACTSRPPLGPGDNGEAWRSLQQHMLNLNADGGVNEDYAPDEIYPDTADLPPWSERTCREFRKDDKKPLGDYLSWSIDHIMQGFDSYAREQLKKGKQARAMLIIHGGLVSLKKGIREANTTLGAMQDEEDFYPIFINWEAGIAKSYNDHLLRVRNGERVNRLHGYSTAPFVMFADLGRAVGRLPIFLYEQARYVIDGQRKDGKFHTSENASSADKRIPKGWQHSVQLPDTNEKPESNAGDRVGAVIPGVLRVVTTPVADFAGTGAYGNMLRRSRLMFLLDDDFNHMQHLACGGLSRLMEELRAYELYSIKSIERSKKGSRNRGEDKVTKLRALQIRRRSHASRETHRIDAEINQLGQQLNSDSEVLAITVIAHSMGGIVTNELIHRNNDLYFDNVVYMAAANSTKDFAALSLPYLEANPTTRYYSLSLHPFREVNEISGFYTLPEGSLLTWLDRFLINSKSRLDHTQGTWNNTAKSLAVVTYLERDVRRRFTIKVFDAEADTPQKHGDFNDPPCTTDCKEGEYPGSEFWKPRFWQLTQ